MKKVFDDLDWDWWSTARFWGTYALLIFFLGFWWGTAVGIAILLIADNL